MYKNKFISLINNIYLVLFSLEDSKKSQSVWPNGWVFVYELSGCGFESRCSQTKYTTSFFTLLDKKQLKNLQKQQLQKTFSECVS